MSFAEEQESILTSNLSLFSDKEREDAQGILQLWNSNGLPKNFENSGVRLVKNQMSGYVFLTNEEFQVALIDYTKNELVDWLTCPECGKEGHLRDFSKHDECCFEFIIESFGEFKYV